MSVNYPIEKTPVIGFADPMYENTWDRANIELYEDEYLVEHDGSGLHTAAGPLCILETGKYTGNVTARTINLQLTTLNIKFLEIYCSDATYGDYVLMRSALMTGDATKRCTNEAFTTNEITELGQGYFKLGTSNYVNATDVEYFFIAYGTVSDLDGVSGDAGDYDESELDWMQHGEDIEVDENGDGPPTRPAKQFRAKWEHDHYSPSGIHKASAFPGIGKIEPIHYTGENNVPREIDLADPTITIKKFLLWANDTQYPLLKTASMAANAVKYMNNTAFDTSGDITFGNGKLTINDAALDATDIDYYGVIFGE